MYQNTTITNLASLFLLFGSIVAETTIFYTQTVDNVLIIFLIFIFFLIVIGLYNYLFVLPNLNKKVEVISNYIYIRTQHDEEQILIDSITKLRLKNTLDLFRVFSWTLDLEALSNDAWKTIAWYPILGLIGFIKYPLDTTIIKEILIQNPHVELSNDLEIYMQTGRFHVTNLYPSWITKDLSYRLIGLAIITIIWIIVLIIF